MYVIKQPKRKLFLIYRSPSHHAQWTEFKDRATQFNAPDAKLFADLYRAIPISVERFDVQDSGEPDTVDNTCFR